jgi:hypothetical protein
MKSKLNQYKIIEGNTNEYQQAIDAVGSYFDTQQTKLIQITNDVSQNIHEYKDLRREMNEVDNTPTSNPHVTFSTTQGNETTGSSTFQDTNTQLYDGSINLVDVEPTYNPKNHSVEISSPIYLEGSYSHVYIENDVLYVKDMNLQTADVAINLDFYTKKLERNYLFPGNEHPIKDDRYNVSKALNDDTELLIQQNKQIGMLGLITTCVLGVGLYVLSRK